VGADRPRRSTGGPGRTLNVYLLGDVVVDAGVRWSRRRLARQLAGRQLSAHVLSHAHFDHAGCSAWLCRTLGVPLWCGAEGRRRDLKRPGRHPRLPVGQPAAADPGAGRRPPGQPHPGGRRPRRGFAVLEVPGHSAGALAFWRARDRVLVCGDVLANFGLHPERPRLMLAPAALSSDDEQNRRSAARLAELRPRLARFGHGFRSPTRAGSPTPSTESWQRPRTTHGGLRQARGPHARTPHPRQRRKAKQPAEPHPARPRPGVPGWVRAAGRR
jgi:hydroxyacylglutathione hydrolase